MKTAISKSVRFLAAMALVMWLAATAFAAAPGITGPSFNLTAQQAFLNQPDGEAVYSWGYGCTGTPAGFAPTLPGQNCPTMQVPGPTLIVTEGATVTVCPSVTIIVGPGTCIVGQVWLGKVGAKPDGVPWHP